MEAKEKWKLFNQNLRNVTWIYPVGEKNAIFKYAYEKLQFYETIAEDITV
jgi:hypothetical protein